MSAMNTAFYILLLSALAYGEAETGSTKLLICNMDASSSMREHIGNFTPEELDPHLCTHIIYNKARLDVETHDIVPKYPEIDLHNKGGLGMYNRTMRMKEANPQLKVVLQLCCYHSSFWENDTMTYDVIIQTFIKNTISYLERHGFDGIYITMDNHPEELRLLTGLREEFDKRGFLLFTFLFPVEIPMNNHPMITQENSRMFDAIIVGEYWRISQQETTIISPLKALRNVISDSKQEGISSEKLVVAIPTFALCYKLCNASDAGVSAPICGGGNEGRSGQSEIVLVHSELMYKMSNSSEGWVVQRDNETGMFYGHSNSLIWTSFEDPVSVRAKVQYAQQENLAGVAMMTVDMDDSMGYNAEGVKFPLTRAAYNALHGN